MDMIGEIDNAGARGEIEKAGREYVARWLREFGYFPNSDTKASGSAEIEARGNAKSLLVRVKSAAQPDAPGSLSSDEMRDLISRAARLGLEAWEAGVQLDQQLRQIGDIRWRKLS